MGKLIVFEGTDGSGKATQCGLLADALAAKGIDYRRVEFPRYDEPSSALIKMYLAGDFGTDASAVNPYAASSFYAVDRYASYQQDWGEYYRAGGLILADRYTTSNAVHQGGKLAPEERKTYLDWLFDYEYRLMGLPAPDAVIYLDVDTSRTAENMASRRAQTGRQTDIHESNLDYLTACRAAARDTASRYGWHVVQCMEGSGMRSIESIHDEVLSIIKEII